MTKKSAGWSSSAAFGNCNVPDSWQENKPLANWVHNQRSNKQMLSERQIARLDGIGFVWDIFDHLWERSYAELLAFYEAYGHSNVPARYEENPNLGIWVANLRRRGPQTRERMRKLKAVKFSWSPQDEMWEDNFARLRKYAKRHGNAFVPVSWPEDPSLGTWVAQQRHHRKTGKLSPERIRRLDELDFIWDAQAHVWELRFEELQQFKARFGHCRVPARIWPDNPELPRWMRHHRVESVWQKLTPERRQRLEALGFTPERPRGPIPENVSEYLRQNGERTE